MDFSDLGGTPVSKTAAPKAKKLDFSDLGGKPVSQDPAAAISAPETSLMAPLSHPLDTLNAPFQFAGEAMRMPLEHDSHFRPPTVLQEMGVAKHTKEEPADPFHMVNALIRAGLVKVATGNSDSARAEYARPPSTLDKISDTATGLGMGTMFPKTTTAPLTAAEEGTKALIKGAKDLAEWGGKKAIRTVLGPSEEAQTARLAGDLHGAMSEGQIAEKVAATAKELNTKISDADSKAWDTLRTSHDPYEGAVHKDEISGLLDNVKSKLKVYGGGTVGKAAKAAADAIDKIKEDIQGVGKFVGGKLESQQGVPSITPKNVYLPEASLKGIVQALDQNINWEDKTAQPVNQALEGARVAIDSRLKGQNGKYKEAMTPVAEMMDAKAGLMRKFNLKNIPGEGIVPEDAAIAKIKALGGREMPETTRITDITKKYTGHDIPKEARASKLSKEFASGVDTSRGSRRTIGGGMMGTAAGFLLGHPIAGNVVGTGTGAALDMYGGKVAANLLDTVSKLKGSKMADMLSRVQVERPSSAIQALLEKLGAKAPVTRRALQRQ